MSPRNKKIARWASRAAYSRKRVVSRGFERRLWLPGALDRLSAARYRSPAKGRLLAAIGAGWREIEPLTRAHSSTHNPALPTPSRQSLAPAPRIRGRRRSRRETVVNGAGRLEPRGRHRMRAKSSAHNKLCRSLRRECRSRSQAKGFWRRS